MSTAPVPPIAPAGGAAGRRKRRMTARRQYTNRLTARASTGPKTAGGKAQVARNALRHGLSLPVLSDPAVAPEVVEWARTIAQSVVGQRLDGERHQLACRVAETFIDLRRVRTAKLPLVAEMDADIRNCAGPLKQLVRLDRYEGRALSRRKRAIRAFHEAVMPLRVAAALRQKPQNKGDYPGLDIRGKSSYPRRRQAGAALLLAGLLFFGSFVHDAVALGPVIPSGATSLRLGLGMARTDAHPHPTGVVFPREQVFVGDVSHKNMVSFQAHEGASAYRGRLSWSDEKIVWDHVPLPISALSSWRQECLREESPSDFHNAARHSTGVHHFENNVRLIVAISDRIVPMEDVRSLSGFEASFGASERPVSDIPQPVGGPPKREGKYDKQRIGYFQPPSEYKPVFGSLFVSLLSLGVASRIFSRFRIVAVILAFQATVGILMGFDLWSLGETLWRRI